MHVRPRASAVARGFGLLGRRSDACRQPPCRRVVVLTPTLVSCWPKRLGTVAGMELLLDAGADINHQNAVRSYGNPDRNPDRCRCRCCPNVRANLHAHPVNTAPVVTMPIQRPRSSTTRSQGRRRRAEPRPAVGRKTQCTKVMPARRPHDGCAGAGLAARSRGGPL